MILRIGNRQRATVSRPRILGGPLGVLVAIVGAIFVAILAVVTLGVAALFARRAFGRRGKRPRAVPRNDAPGVTDAAPAPAATRKSGERSEAVVLDAWPLVLAAALSLGLAANAEAKLLVPMDETQTDHLKAYGLAYWVLTQGQKGEWLLNYRGGSFLFAEDPAIQRQADLRGVAIQEMGGADEAAMRAEIADNNMEAVALEKAPRVAVYIPPNTSPWDDAVTLALQYADFPWYVEETQVQQAMATKMGFAKISQLKSAVALTIKDYVGKGGFMFGMCSATDTYDIALAAAGLDIAGDIYDGDPFDPLANQKLDFSRTLAFKDFHLELDPYL